MLAPIFEMPTPLTSEGITTVESPYSIADTVARLKQKIAGKGLTLFVHIDHGAGAREVGLQMQAAHVLVFGHARAGTPLMVFNPLIALDLPLKVLIWEDADERSQVSFNTPEFLAHRHQIPAELVKNISGVAALIDAALA